MNETTSPAAAPPSGGETATTEAADSTEAFDFGDLATHDDSGESDTPIGKGEEVVAAAAVPATPPEAAAAPLPAVSPPATPAPAVAQPPTPLPEVQVQPPVPPQEAPVAEARPSAPELSIEQHREKFLPELQKLYQLSEAEVEELRVNPGDTLPKVAARLHYEVQMATHQGILNVLPQIVQGMVASQMQYTEHERQFFGAWPKLQEAVKSNPRAQEAIENSIKSFRALNPRASTADIIARAGLLASMTLGLPIDTGAQAPVAAAAPAAPARPPGIGATGHIPAAGSPGDSESGDIIADLAAAHLRGDI